MEIINFRCSFWLIAVCRLIFLRFRFVSLFYYSNQFVIMYNELFIMAVIFPQTLKSCNLISTWLSFVYHCKFWTCILIIDITNRVLSKQEIKSAINEILNVNKKDQLLAILEALPSETGTDIKTSEVLKVSLEHCVWVHLSSQVSSGALQCRSWRTIYLLQVSRGKWLDSGRLLTSLTSWDWWNSGYSVLYCA